jgi:hypothetical protein
LQTPYRDATSSREIPYPARALAPDIACEQRAEPVAPQPHGFVTNIDAPLEQ